MNINSVTSILRACKVHSATQFSLKKKKLSSTNSSDVNYAFVRSTSATRVARDVVRDRDGVN